MLRGLIACLFAGTVTGFGAPQPLVVNPADGKAFPTIKQAIDAAVARAAKHKGETRIVIKPGTYREKLIVPKEAGEISLEGEDETKTVIVFGDGADTPRPDGGTVGTFDSATVTFRCPVIRASRLTFENSRGKGSQAVAVSLVSERGEFRNCRLLGCQDTLLIQSGAHWFDRCRIEGDVDFIFGAGIGWFRGCEIHAKDSGYLTAASTPENQPYGFVFDHCQVTVAPTAKRMFLGRPWRPHAAVAYLQCALGKGIDPAGWDNWRNPENEKTARYLEFQNTGEGAAEPGKRVAWARQIDTKEAAAITPKAVLGWEPKP
ncbi:pectinesterase family protein [Luteolibacter sp. LG18]|uniref:pectinesterase family protein n=1 Tax=Luteolibacter sp. LG18 TaxID=2819286 RepID=UPI002B303A03|nr:pectinesterase [Luteolibacter sp. LG18]